MDYNGYANMKEKYKNYERHNTHGDFLTVAECTMFEYEGFPETVDTRFIELYLLTNGACGFGKVENGDLIVTPSHPCGEPNYYGIGTRLIGATPRGRYEGIIGETTAYGYNNRLGLPDFEIMHTADILAETDTSIDLNILYSRYLPIPVCHDEKTKTALNSVLENLKKGISTVISGNILRKLETGGSEIEVVDITDVKNSDKIQYLTHLKDDVFRQFFTYRGQCNNGTGKMAQQTKEEITGDLSISFILPIEMLNERQKMCNMVNKVFGLNTKVKFSTPWAVEYEKFKMSVEEVKEETPKKDGQTEKESEVKENE